MTLIQTLLTPFGVLQVSDRQLTDAHGRVRSSTANKAVVWCGHMVVGFSGMAYTDSTELRPISEWIALALRGAATVGDAFLALQQAGSQLMADTDFTRRALTMVLAGSPPGERAVMMFAISNSMPTDAVPEKAASRFSRSNDLVVPLHGSQFLYKTIGVQFPPEVERRCEFNLVRIYERHGIDHAARHMIAIQRRVHSFETRRRGGSTVGRSAMVVSLPATQDPDPALTLVMASPASGKIRDGVAMYSYVPDYGFSAVRFGPHFVCDSGVGFSPRSGLAPSSGSATTQRWSIIKGV